MSRDAPVPVSADSRSFLLVIFCLIAHANGNVVVTFLLSATQPSLL